MMTHSGKNPFIQKLALPFCLGLALLLCLGLALEREAAAQAPPSAPSAPSKPRPAAKSKRQAKPKHPEGKNPAAAKALAQRSSTGLEGEAAMISCGDLEKGLRGHAAWFAQGRYYIAGGCAGADAPTTTGVRSAAWLPESRIGPWCFEKPLPRPLHGLASACAVEGQSVYLAGGASGAWMKPPFSNQIQRARMTPSGEIIEWTESAPWPGPGLAATSLIAAPGALYVIGGLEESGKASARVFRAGMDSSGNLTGWSAQTPLPHARVGHAAWFAREALFVAGGGSRPGAADSLWAWRAPVAAGGSVGAWDRVLPPMPKAVAGGAGVRLTEHLFWVGGFDGAGQPLSELRQTRNIEDRLAPWAASSLSVPACDGFALAADPANDRLIFSGGTLLADSQRLSTAVLALDIIPFGTEARKAAKDLAISGNTALSQSKAMTPPPKPSPADPNATPLFPANSPFPKFQPAAEAAREAGRRQRPLLVFLYSASDKAGAQLRDNVLHKRQFYTLMSGIVLGEGDVDASPGLLKEHEVNRTPVFVLYDSKGKLVARDYQSRTLKDFAALIAPVR